MRNYLGTTLILGALAQCDDPRMDEQSEGHETVEAGTLEDGANPEDTEVAATNELEFEGTMFTEKFRAAMQPHPVATQAYVTGEGNLEETITMLSPASETTVRSFTSPAVDGVSKHTEITTIIDPSETGINIVVAFKNPESNQVDVTICDLKWSGNLMSGTCSIPGLAEELN